MKAIKELLARQHKCAESDIQIISPAELPKVEKSTLVNVEYQLNGESYLTKVNVEPPIDVGTN